MARAIPEGFHTITPSLIMKDSAKAIEFYKQAFSAKELMRMPGPGGKGIMHAELQIGDSRFFLCDEFPEMSNNRSPETLGAVTAVLHLYVQDVDATVNKAVSAGAKLQMPATNMFWGDRFAKISDPFGQEWGVCTHVEDVSPEEIKKRADAFFAQAASSRNK